MTSVVLMMNPPVPPKYTKRSDRRAVQNLKVKLRCKLQDLIDEHGLTRTAVTEATGLTAGAIRGLCENNTKRYDADTITALCVYFDCQISDLFELVPKDAK
ncbi:helix-turn-helix domain-containing protein [Nostoc sp. CCY0012]|uniref:helix-turn-helix domain-containing protein n=1 Tax=Nostoc sp. CCY0012 TaxID=1056123 RepID=UPI0039C63B6B